VGPSRMSASSPGRNGRLTIALRRLLPIVVVLLAGLPMTATAQRPRGSGDGFLFSPPVVSFSLRGGYDYAMGRSDIFDFTTTNLTLDRRDFASLGLNFDLNVPLSPRTDLVFSGGLAKSDAPSEFRKFIDNNDLPIEQTTQLRRHRLGVGVRYALTAPGEQLSALAWIPSKFTPYVGLGAGAVQWKFRQQGDWVNFDNLDVFRSEFSSSGWAPMGYAHVGADYSLSKRLALTSDLRYTYSKGKLEDSFENFARIDLSGAAATMGITVRY
jgi:hypothetical protein